MDLNHSSPIPDDILYCQYSTYHNSNPTTPRFSSTLWPAADHTFHPDTKMARFFFLLCELVGECGKCIAGHKTTRNHGLCGYNFGFGTATPT
jgi:hypothetical protein